MPCSVAPAVLIIAITLVHNVIVFDADFIVVFIVFDVDFIVVFSVVVFATFFLMAQS